MRFALLSVALFAASALAQDLSQVPACSLTCFTSVSPGSCDASDYACLCSSQDFVSQLTQCITGACTTPEDLQGALTFGAGFCQTAGVSVDLSGASAAATAVSSSASSASSALSSAVSELSSSASAASSSGSLASSASSVASSISSLASSASSAVASATGAPTSPAEQLVVPGLAVAFGIAAALI